MMGGLHACNKELPMRQAHMFSVVGSSARISHLSAVPSGGPPF